MSISDHIKFFGAFVKNPKQVGAIAPSSDALAKAMVADIQLDKPQTVVEFGPGTGSFTKAIQRRLRTEDSEARYLGIERDEGFVEILRKRFPDMDFVHGSAEHMPVYHKQVELPPVGTVVSGLPFASLPLTVQDSITTMLSDTLKGGTMFRTFQYVHAYGLPTAVRFRKRMKSLGLKMESRRVIFYNLPPAFVLSWTREH
ncbi:class I SAM-dependent methyltransferase [Poriferisphaera sp. WC338]|uniref:class I SAM-dependent methyltransferase n=1 Tax=Poriferisphaera sp. WC338 TaxID=3425129 RepID=UPI003D816EFF